VENGMQIDVIVATYNRAALLERAVLSILKSGLSRRNSLFDFTITVVDNNSSDGTPNVVARLSEVWGDRVRYLFEPRQGKSYALNTGISATKGDVIAFADDDQVMDDEWLCAIYQAIADGYDYVTGPVCGDWEVEPPAWYDYRLHGVLSLLDVGDARVPHYDNEIKNGFSGGNGACRRSVIERIGGFRHGLVKLEDGEFYMRMIRAGFRGLYEPRMKITHRVPCGRVTKSYFRSWQRIYGHSVALIDTIHPRPVVYYFGVPRFLVRQTSEVVPRMITAFLRADWPGVFQQELNLWFMFGFIEGKLQKDLRFEGSQQTLI
jgi:glycosyltransferase involved in cell wall biosynthesis